MSRAEVSESAATGELAELYDDIRQTLGTPVVNLIYRMLAAYPPYLDLAWRAIRPSLVTVYAERAFVTIRERAAEPVIALAGLPDPGPHVTAIAASVEAYNETNPKGLLIATACLRALEGHPAPGSGQESEPAGAPRALRPTPPMTELSDVSAETRALLLGIQDAHGLGGVPSLYRTLAWWPDWLAQAWPALTPLITNSALTARRAELLGLTNRLAEQLPYPVDVTRDRLLAAGLTKPEIGEIREVLASFQRGIPVALITGLTIRRLLPEY
ncbi:MAG: hypothetical protein HY329_08765 [Chloroflexi bacterium]|nr:hypothetical protein [Chloroflexota bacterium]